MLKHLELFPIFFFPLAVLQYSVLRSVVFKGALLKWRALCHFLAMMKTEFQTNLKNNFFYKIALWPGMAPEYGLCVL